MKKMSLRKCLVVGLNSGTSMDGVDTVLMEISEDRSGQLNFRQLSYLTHPYPLSVKDNLLRMIESKGTVGDGEEREGTSVLRDLCAYNALLGRLFADAAKALVTQAGVNMCEVALIGSHGQTVYHLPPGDGSGGFHGYAAGSTLQIGDPSVIANLCGVTTVGDFRTADVAVGGQGAPLVPYLDGILLSQHFEKTGRVGVALNIGGISNMTAFIPGSGGSYSLTGFDCGPGNVLVDMLAKMWYGEEFDRDGDIAKSGKVSSDFLDLLMEDQFVSRPLPKSTGREHYNRKYLEGVVETARKLELSNQDCMATVSEFTVAAVSYHFDRHVRPLLFVGREQEGEGAAEEEGRGIDLFVCGGGVKNEFMMADLRRRLSNVEVFTTSKLGIEPEAKEACLFAVLAYQTYRWRPTNVPNVTGAGCEVIQGKICPVSRKTKK